MLYKKKKIIETLVDTKSKVNSFLISLLLIIFPLNQQYHFRPFPSVDGFIIDYLITKISIPEIIVFLLFFLNIRKIFKSIVTWAETLLFWIFLLIIFSSIYRSEYVFLAIYENLLILVLIALGHFFYQNLKKLNKTILIRSIKFWILSLSLLGFLQFFLQQSVFDNYSLFGEFPYTEDYYHIKQKSLFFENTIPPYAIFSHSNIFGGYLLFLLLFLNILKKDFPIFYGLIFLDLIFIGSAACLLAFFILLLALKMPFKMIRNLLKILTISSLVIYFLNSFKFGEYQNDFSIYRRLYMFDLSANLFNENPFVFLLGSGYYNYFISVKNYLYNYELVRFFQPPHYLPIFIIWQYGVSLIFWFGFLIYKFKNNATISMLKVLVLIVTLGSFDHYIFSNHQFRILLLLLVPYSLKIKNSI